MRSPKDFRPRIFASIWLRAWYLVHRDDAFRLGINSTASMSEVAVSIARWTLRHL